MPASLISHPSTGKEVGGAFSKGETCQKSGGFHQLGRCVREGRESGVRSDFADLPLCFAFPVAVSLEGQMTLSRRLPLMKTTRFLAGPFNNCAHPGIGAARDKSPDPCLPLSPDPLLPCLALGCFCGGHQRRIPIAFIALRTGIGQLALVLQPAVADRGCRPIPISACRFAQS